MEYRRDFAGERFHASRNYGSFRHTYEAPGASRATVDWNLQLRQVAKPKPSDKAASMPNLRTAGRRQGQERQPLADEHPHGPYHCETDTVGRYQNVSDAYHMLRGPRACSGAHAMDWQLNLREGGPRRSEDAAKWRRHFARPQQSFDMMKENCGPENADYQKSHVTPQDRRPDRRSGALPIETIRDDPINLRRSPGCEGTQVGQWRHLIEDVSRGRATRRALEHGTTLRERAGDPNGARITDNRSDGCIVEMLGKKQWTKSVSHEPLAQPLPEGDPKLYHMSNLRLLPEQDEENRQLRMSRHPRRQEAPGFLPKSRKERAGLADPGKESP